MLCCNLTSHGQRLFVKSFQKPCSTKLILEQRQPYPGALVFFAYRELSGCGTIQLPYGEQLREACCDFILSYCKLKRSSMHPSNEPCLKVFDSPKDAICSYVTLNENFYFSTFSAFPKARRHGWYYYLYQETGQLQKYGSKGVILLLQCGVEVPGGEEKARQAAKDYPAGTEEGCKGHCKARRQQQKLVSA